MRALLWFRGKDLRLHDHAALTAALGRSRELALVFVLQPKHFEPTGGGQAPHRMQCLLQALRALTTSIEARGNQLLIVPGPATIAIPALAARLQVDRVYASRCSEPGARRTDEHVAAALRVPLELCDGETLARPGSIRTRSGSAFSVFTAFTNAFRAQVPSAEILPVPDQLPPPPAAGAALHKPLPQLSDLRIAPNPRLHVTSETAAHARMATFFDQHARNYPELRDRMDLAATSQLSTDLHFGTISIRTLWNTTHAELTAGSAALERFSAQLLWREFAHHTLFDRPELIDQPFRRDFATFPWQTDQSAWDAWVAGMTGYPVVDAAARQLRSEGFVHNRARMIAASFLTKHLMLHYGLGEAHYLRYLSDGDLAQNNLGWQWSAGTGCDAQPYFRVFSPQKQGERFDPNGDYVRRYVPELAALPAKYIHAPWRAPSTVLQQAGIVIGRTYPAPIVDHDSARRRFLLVASTRNE